MGMYGFEKTIMLLASALEVTDNMLRTKMNRRRLYVWKVS